MKKLGLALMIFWASPAAFAKDIVCIRENTTRPDQAEITRFILKPAADGVHFVATVSIVTISQGAESRTEVSTDDANYPLVCKVDEAKLVFGCSGGSRMSPAHVSLDRLTRESLDSDGTAAEERSYELDFFIGGNPFAALPSETRYGIRFQESECSLI